MIGAPNIHGKDQRFAAEFFDFSLRAFQSIKATRD
jgi:hypothetical protein